MEIDIMYCICVWFCDNMTYTVYGIYIIAVPLPPIDEHDDNHQKNAIDNVWRHIIYVVLRSRNFWHQLFFLRLTKTKPNKN